MVLDALRGYLQLASGVTEVPRQRAVAAARSLLVQGAGADTGGPGLQQQVAALAEELMVTSRANREFLLGVIRTEVERTLARLGIASADDVDTLRRSVERLERLVRAQQSSSEQAAPAPTARAGRTPRTATAPAAAATGTRTSAGKSTGAPKGTSGPASTSAPSATARSAPARSAPARSAPAKSAPARSAPARSAPEKSAREKSAPAKSPPDTGADSDTGTTAPNSTDISGTAAHNRRASQPTREPVATRAATEQPAAQGRQASAGPAPGDDE